MIEGPLFSFFGAKWMLGPHYPGPVHRHIIEPFAGSACYALRHYQCDVTLVEKDPVVASVWRYLLAASPEEILALPDVPEGGTTDDLAVTEPQRALIGFRINPGQRWPARTVSSWMRNKDGGLYWGDSARRRIANALPLVRHWTLIEGDYTEAPDVRATWFVDPPYQTAGKRYRCGSGAIDFAALAAWCRSRTGQVIACENVGAEWLPFRALRTIGTVARKDGDPGSHEAVWIAGDGQLALEGFQR